MEVAIVDDEKVIREQIKKLTVKYEMPKIPCLHMGLS